MTGMTGMTGQRYIGQDQRKDAVGPLIARLARWGISLKGSRELTVVGRKSGQPHSNPVNLLRYDGSRYLVAPRGHTQWVRNLRAAGEGRLRLGRRIEHFRAVELDDQAKPDIIAAYLREWRWEVGMFFADLSKNPTHDDLLAIAPGYPVFRIEPVPGSHR